MYATSDRLQSVFIASARCAECAEPPCMKACPEKVDIRGAIQFIVQNCADAARVKAVRAAEEYADAAIEESYA